MIRGLLVVVATWHPRRGDVTSARKAGCEQGAHAEGGSVARGHRRRDDPQSRRGRGGWIRSAAHAAHDGRPPTAVVAVDASAKKSGGLKIPRARQLRASGRQIPTVSGGLRLLSGSGGGRLRRRRNPPSEAGFGLTERRRSRTDLAWGCQTSPVLKTGWATGPLPLRVDAIAGARRGRARASPLSAAGAVATSGRARATRGSRSRGSASRRRRG